MKGSPHSSAPRSPATQASPAAGIHNGPAFLPGSGSEQLVLTGSEISGNSADFGGGIYNKGVVTLHGRTRIGGNTADAVGQGGGIYNDPGATVIGVRHRTFRPANISGPVRGLHAVADDQERARRPVVMVRVVRRLAVLPTRRP